jgi:hypothetical protein
MRRRLSSALALGVIVLTMTSSAKAYTGVSIDDVLRNARTYDDRDISVSGEVRDLNFQTHYAYFQICNPKCLNVVAWGHPNVWMTEHRIIHGRFYRVKEIDQYKVHNVIEVEQGAL